MQIIESKEKLGKVTPNIALMLNVNVNRFNQKIIFQDRKNEHYEGITWEDFYRKIEYIAFNLRRFGFNEGDKVLIFSKNSLEMLLFELAVMSSGGISVPIFFNYNKETAESLFIHSDAKFLAAGSKEQLNKISPDIVPGHKFALGDFFDEEYPGLISFNDLVKEKHDNNFRLNFEANPNDICLNMYTSGTMGNQKCVQLTHRNILSQQAAIKSFWKLDENDRFLSYLRWHHSFGGIFEKYAALCNGATLSLESSHGLDPFILLENWKLVQPTVFFSVPMIYNFLVGLALKNKDIEKCFFHPGLKFVFTAAASLPQYISEEFEKRNISVIEGWGLTETSPCCTLTDPKIKREPGVIGFPIPGVTIQLDYDNEMLIKGPNVMVGYYKNDNANKDCFTEDGWFRTGDIGELTDKGFKLISRKDRIFKLSNAEKVIPSEIENIITDKCHFIAYALVEGSGRDYPVALLFPNNSLLAEARNGHKIEIDNCVCPRDLTELSSCLKGCLSNVNCGLKQKFARIKSVMLMDEVLKVENKTLTPSMKLAPNNVKSIYKANIESLYGWKGRLVGNAYVIFLED